MEVNPAAQVKLHRQDAQPHFVLSDEEEGRLLKAAEASKARHLMPIVVLALATAMRKDEILGLTWDMVDLRKATNSLPGSNTKNKRVKNIPINADADQVLLKQSARKHESSPYVFPGRAGQKMHDFKTAWVCAKKRAGIPARCRFHDLRHTAVSRMVMRGIDPVTIGRLAGWTDSSAPIMIRRYAHLSGDHLRQAAKALESGRIKHKLSTNHSEVDFSEGREDSISPHYKSARSSAG